MPLCVLEARRHRDTMNCPSHLKKFDKCWVSPLLTEFDVFPGSIIAIDNICVHPLTIHINSQNTNT